MKRKEREFHETVLNILYPPLSPPPSSSQEEVKEEEEPSSYAFLDLEEYKGSSSEEEEDTKLTRAQRKNIRKKKLKEAAEKRMRRGIGPLLLSTHTILNDKNDSESGVHKSNQGSAHKKLSNRRMAKKLNYQSRDVSSKVDATPNHTNFPQQ